MLKNETLTSGIVNVPNTSLNESGLRLELRIPTIFKLYGRLSLANTL
jgi:hypothetical protein